MSEAEQATTALLEIILLIDLAFCAIIVWYQYIKKNKKKAVTMKQKALENMALRYYRQLKILGYKCNLELINRYHGTDGRSVPAITMFYGDGLIVYYSFDTIHIGGTTEKFDQLIQRGMEGLIQ